MWLGLIIGTASLIGLVHAVHGPRCRGRWGHAPDRSCGDGPWHEDSCHGFGHSPCASRFHFGHRAVLRAVLSRLDTTPGQEKAIVQALDELRQALRETQSPLKEAHGAVGRVVSGPAFDEAAWNEMDQKLQFAGVRARDAARAALTKIHAALDDRQREKLGSLMQSGFCHGWPCR